MADHDGPFDRIYLETDGKVYLRAQGERLVLPRSADDAPCPFDVAEVLELQGLRVAICTPHLESHPAEWHDKDDLPGMDEVEAVARLAVNRTLLRTIANVAAVRDGKVLLVRGSRGLTSGVWHFPGGFVTMGEEPADAIVREVHEELGLQLQVTQRIGSYQFRSGPGYYIRGDFFIGTLAPGEPEPDPDEIAELKWIDSEEAVSRLLHRFDEPQLAPLRALMELR